MVNAVVLINVARGQIEGVGEQLAEIPGVTALFSVAGRVDIVANVRVQNNEDLAEVVAKRFLDVPGVDATETLIAFRVYSKADQEVGFSM
jgi:DNA-binding Lrp family transcriptional regulator